MVRCDTCNGWCHYDCAKVGDEIQNLDWNCESCVNMTQELSPPLQNYSTPPEFVSDSSALEIQTIAAMEGGAFTISSDSNVQQRSTPVAADTSTNAASTQTQEYTRVSGDDRSSTSLYSQATMPIYPPICSGVVSTVPLGQQQLLTTIVSSPHNTYSGGIMTSSTKSSTPSIGVMKATGVQQQQQFVQQARSCSSANEIYVTQNQPSTMLQQHTSYYCPANGQQQSDTVNTEYNDVTNQKRTLELQFLEEERKLNQQFLQRKYEIMQQRGELPNAQHNNNVLSFQQVVFPSNNVTINQPTPQQLSARQILPKELPPFNGDPEEWPIFISSYENSTSIGGYSNAENLIRLQQCLKGRAREMVRNKLLLPQMVPEIIDTLRMYFGRPELILDRMIDKARQMPPPKDKLEAIIDFAMCVRNICSTIEACQLEAHLNNPMLVRELLDKLSNNYKLQWAMTQKPIGVPVLKSFSEWLYTIAMAASQVATPVFSKKNVTLNTHTEDTPVNMKCFSCKSVGHKLSKCSLFGKLSSQRKWAIVREHRVCTRCLGSHRRKCFVDRECGINGCKEKHHPLLHEAAAATTNMNDREQKSEANVGNVHSHQVQNDASLFRILPIRVHAEGKYIDTYAFLDEGSSVTLMEEDIFNAMNLRGKEETICLKWTGETKRTVESLYVESVSVSNPATKPMFKLKGVHTVRNLSLPLQSLDADSIKAKYPYLSSIPLSSYKKVKPTILIGADNWNLAVPLKICEGPWDCPIATKTRLGWAVQGNVNTNLKDYQVNIHLCECEGNYEKIHEALNRMYALESSPSKTIHSTEDEKALSVLDATSKYIDGRFEVGLPWRSEEVTLPDSYGTAYKRAVCLRKKMDKDSDLKIKVTKEFNNLIEKGYARKLNEDEIGGSESRVWYLPIFITCNPNKPDRARLVWDAAAKTNGVSLNDFLLAGPDLLTSLLDILLTFRVGKVAICGDIAEMFHQIRIRNEDYHAQRFLWWNEGEPEPGHYVMEALTFGLNAAPCIAHFIRNKNADRFEGKYPRAVEAIKKYHYVDDLIDSVDDEEDAKRLADQISQIHASAGFKIRNWSSNSQAVLDHLHENKSSTQNPRELGCTEKILGVHWDPSKDVFQYIFKFPKLERRILDQEIIPTKREVLKVLMSIYDPLGFASLYTIDLKILFQEIWRSGIEWDEPLNRDLAEKWEKWKRKLPLIAALEIPRCYSDHLQEADEIQLHIFVDAGEFGYAAICYLRIKKRDQVSIALVMAKSKVSPLKPVSIPRLELQAAVLGIRLASKIKEIDRIPVDSCIYWSDSKTVLHWLRMDPRKFRPFVMHRVGEILENSHARQWRWVPSKHNPADLATKDNPKANTELWLSGPDFLLQSEDNWPRCKDRGTADTTEIRTYYLEVHTKEHTTTINIDYFSDWRRLYRATAKWFLYMKKLRASSRGERKPDEVSHEMICQAKTVLLKQAQLDVFPIEIYNLKRGKRIESDSPLRGLDIFLDEMDGLIKIHGRTEHLRGYVDVIVLPPKHKVTSLIIKHYHEKYHHVSHETVINSLKGQYHIQKLRVLYKTVRKNCQHCKITTASPKIPLMGSLPKGRLGAYEKPFTYTGIDFFGPMIVTFGRRSEKRWGVIFTCMTTRAIHLEVAHSLDTSSCIMCLRNFIGRRGYPRVIYSDNGTNFKATERILREELQRLSESELARSFDDIKWYFNPPAAPHRGGAWERLVRSVKTVLHQAYPNNKFNDETLRSALIEVEFIINSRPLTFVSLESEDDEALTPNHLLLGSSTGYKPIFTKDTNLREKWNQVQAFANRFWERWLKEYAPIITRRSKWFERQKPVDIGDVVLIVDEHQPRNCWLRGVVIDRIVAKDGQVGRATVQTKNGIVHRPVSKIAVLDVGNREKGKAGELDPLTEGGMLPPIRGNITAVENN
ncbi:uncharacterized protein [Musca autumnalis]|uniref:uncharacterized protein n=1 Tax=Musca autumnalis TaxID=221902 RepID=UPI003CE785F6